MTVYEKFEDYAKINRDCASKTQNGLMADLFLRDAERWERRSKTLTPEVASKNCDDVDLWRIIETVDKINQEVFS